MAKDKEKENQDNEAMVAEFLAKGGQIQKMPFGLRSDPQDMKPAWGKPRAAAKKKE